MHDPLSAEFPDMRLLNRNLGQALYRIPPQAVMQRPWIRFIFVATCTLLALLGLAMLLLGARIVILGGTIYYAFAGALLVAGGVLAWQRTF